MFTFSASYFQNLLLTLPAILIAISFHEMAHGYAADAMGDPTPRLAGRLTLNPIKHIDPIGMLSMLLFRFGWAKPVPVNSSYFKDRKKGIILVSLSGCLTNFVLAFIALVTIYLLASVNNAMLHTILMYIYIYNIYFGVFNLLPIPPLDGSHILEEFLPNRWKNAYVKIAQYGTILLIGMMIFGVFGYVISPIFNLVDGFFRFIVNGLYMLINLLI